MANVALIHGHVIAMCAFRRQGSLFLCTEKKKKINKSDYLLCNVEKQHTSHNRRRSSPEEQSKFIRLFIDIMLYILTFFF